MNLLSTDNNNAQLFSIKKKVKGRWGGGWTNAYCGL